MDYKEKYNEALERAKELFSSKRSVLFKKQTLESIFPELCESDDERIKKKILRKMWACQKESNFFDDEEIAWVEKQKEQKPIDKVEPKFKVGDWINGYYTSYKILSINNEGYVVEDVDGNIINILFENEKFHHLWTIQDAKDGDVLYSLDSKKPFIYKERPQYSQARGYCCINKFGEFAVWNTSKCVICTDKYIPATKEQRDLLFQKMKEAGYEWDAEKKELKKIDARENLTLDGDLMQADCMMVEQKSAEWREEDKIGWDEAFACVTRAEKAAKNEEELQNAVTAEKWLKSLRPQKNFD